MSRRKPSRLWGPVVGGLLGAAGVSLYLRHREEIDYYVRLLHAKVTGDLFYSRYPHLAKNAAYGPGAAERLDVYRPASGSDHPVLIYIHGGSWNTGNKELYAPVAQRLLPEGTVVVIPGYTLYPGATFRQQAAEVARAVAWTLENVSRFGGDSRRVILGGQSAGGHLSALALFDPQYLAAQGHSAAEVCGWYGIAGVYDIGALMEFEWAHGRSGEIVAGAMEGPGNFAAASPLAYARADLPPALIIHGDADTTVPLSISEMLHARLSGVGASSKLLVYPGAGHSRLMFDALAQNPSRLVQDLSEFARNCAPVGR